MHQPPRLSRRLLALLAALLAGGAQAQIATWANPGNGSWLDALNWNPAAVPGTNSPVVISNGGNALLSGIAQTPMLNVLNVGVSNFGNGRGSLISSGTAVRSSGPFFVGYATGGGNRVADGRLEIGLADGQASSAFVGALINATVAAQATGVLQVDGALPLNGSLYAGANFGSLAGSAADGRVRIGGNAGTVNSLLVGETFLGNAAQVGGSNQGLLQIGGNLVLGSGAFFNVGNTGFVDRVADPLAAGGFRVNQASGNVQIAGTLTLSGAAAFTNIGTAEGGVAAAVVTLGELDTRAGRFADVNIGRSGARGQATGSLAAASGDLRTTQSVSVGITGGGIADGSLQLGSGQLLGSSNGGVLTVGVASGNNLPTATARGSVDAGGGVAGFAGYSVGNVFTRGTAGTRAEGSMTGGSGAGPTAAGSVLVGTILGSGENVQAQGSLVMGSSLLLQNAFVAVGENDSASRGSRAVGELRIGGDAGTSTGMVLGNVPNFANPNQVGSSASGVLHITGSLTLADSASAFVGNTSGFDRVVDPAAARGVRVNEARADARIDGTLAFGANTTLSVGTTEGGSADGSLAIGRVEMGANRLARLPVGVASGLGEARGRLEIGGGLLRADLVQLGAAAGGSASGTLVLSSATLDAQNLFAGTGVGGQALISLRDARAGVAQDMLLQSGSLSLVRSLIEVFDQLMFGDAALLQVDIDGLARTLQYGAINAHHSTLAGLLEIDFSDLNFSGDSAAFDILRSDGVNGIDGDFRAQSFLAVPSGYRASAGIELDGAEVYRVRLTRQLAVSEPPAWLLVALALPMALTVRRRRFWIGKPPVRQP